MCEPARRQITEAQREHYRKLRAEGSSLSEATRLAGVSLARAASFGDEAIGEREPHD